MAPDGDISTLDEAAVSLHEMFVSLRKAGFSRSEATSVIAKIAAEAMRLAGDDEGDDTGNG